MLVSLINRVFVAKSNFLLVLAIVSDKAPGGMTSVGIANSQTGKNQRELGMIFVG
jgi:hypothetical protein